MTFSIGKIIAPLGIAAMVFTPAAVQAEAPHPQIAVVGQGVVSVAPNMAHVTVGVTHQADTAADALSMMNNGLQAVLDRLDGAGIDSKHMQTSQLRLNQTYENYENTRRPSGYEASSDLNVQVHDLPKLGEILDALVRDGANELRGLNFDLSDRSPHVQAARRAAVADALAKADLYAQAAGVGLGDLLLISETSDASGGYRPEMQNARFESDMAVSSVPVEAGELKITATINMVWSIE